MAELSSEGGEGGGGAVSVDLWLGNERRGIICLWDKLLGVFLL